MANIRDIMAARKDLVAMPYRFDPKRVKLAPRVWGVAGDQKIDKRGRTPHSASELA